MANPRGYGEGHVDRPWTFDFKAFKTFFCERINDDLMKDYLITASKINSGGRGKPSERQHSNIYKL